MKCKNCGHELKVIKCSGKFRYEHKNRYYKNPHKICMATFCKCTNPEPRAGEL